MNATAPDALFGSRAQLADVASHSVGGGLALLLANVAIQAIRFIAMLVVARILTPADFGVFAIVMGFVGMAGLFWELGLATATVQSATITPQQVSALFWIHTACGATLTLLGVLGAPWLGRLYGDPRIETMCRLIAFMPLLGALGMQHLALLQRALRFRQTALISLAAVVLGSGLTVLMTVDGLGFVALAIGVLAASATTTVLAWLICPWRPGPFRVDAPTRQMLAFGGQLVGFGLLGTLANGLQSTLLGLLTGADSVGIYYRAQSLLQVFQGVTLGTLATVVVASLSHLKDRPEEFRSYYLGCVMLLAALCTPVAVAGWLFSHELLLVIYGPQWGPSAPLFAILSLGLVPYALSFSTGWLYVSLGHTSRMMRWGLLGWSLVIGGTLIGLPLGLRGLAIAQTITVFVVFVPCMALAFQGTRVTWRDLAHSTWRPVLAALLAAAVVATTEPWLPAAPWLRLITGGALLGSIYLFVFSEPLGQRPAVVRFARRLMGRAESLRSTRS